jgi:hypothetical protein
VTGSRPQVTIHRLDSFRAHRKSPLAPSFADHQRHPHLIEVEVIELEVEHSASLDPVFTMNNSSAVRGGLRFRVIARS